MSRCRESSGASFGSQITPPAESSCGNAWASMASLRKSPSVASRPTAPPPGGERRAGARAKPHLAPADMNGVGRVAGLHVELPRRLRHLLEHELRVEFHHVVLHLLA